MKLSPQIVLAQQTRLKLSQDMLRAIGFLELSNLELAISLREITADNPWIELHLPSALESGIAVEAETPSLISHVLAQLPDLVPAPQDRSVALELIDEMDSNGFIIRPIEEIAQRSGLPIKEVLRILTALQKIEPRGLFARSVSECLALQLEETETISEEMRCVLDALPSLSRGGFAALQREVDLPEDSVTAALARLRTLNPRPAACFASSHALPRLADLVFHNRSGAWEVDVNPDTMPKATLIDPGTAHRTAGTRLSQERSEARNLIMALERRRRSLLSIGRILAREQAEFLTKGAGAQRPLTMRAVAAELDLHESTVGRIVNSGAAATPLGTFPLRTFFCRGVRRRDQTAPPTSEPAILLRINEIVKAEEPGAPLSDAGIAEKLASEGIMVSRRVTARLRARAGLGNRAERRRRHHTADPKNDLK
ncbi:RNA polymerase, sigma 54 subunit, RpoN/SigL [Salinihabitans flavidus]|uniref:RNA polymerase sigma-54 factor n=1 Tax=Salinihabitans flavidus TaxID=569882 RepID=A0A1H8VDT9_9RHOB|nr:hypothetical protein [Salinihabitans flavidus]SEP13433.1 RNA polymerase, sigma 54 subunit, RpoN/SigL [Salinihabitans flavidus]